MISTNTKSKCKGCTDRYPGCHDHCEHYKEYRKALDEYAEKQLKAKKENAPFLEKRRRIVTKKLRTKGKLK